MEAAVFIILMTNTQYHSKYICILLDKLITISAIAIKMMGLVFLKYFFEVLMFLLELRNTSEIKDFSWVLEPRWKEKNWSNKELYLDSFMYYFHLSILWKIAQLSCFFSLNLNLAMFHKYSWHPRCYYLELLCLSCHTEIILKPIWLASCCYY